MSRIFSYIARIVPYYGNFADSIKSLKTEKLLLILLDRERVYHLYRLSSCDEFGYTAGETHQKS